jgi:hypothetical protein
MAMVGQSGGGRGWYVPWKRLLWQIMTWADFFRQAHNNIFNGLFLMLGLKLQNSTPRMEILYFA